MKKGILLICLSLLCSITIMSQESSSNKINDWITKNNISIRKSFDGTKNENKPAGISFQENHVTNSGFFNIDAAVKLNQLEFISDSRSSLILYPKIEWHKSTDSTDLKNKLDGGINIEYIPFGLKSPGLPANLPNKGLVVSPLIQGTSSFRRNFIQNSNEIKAVAQISFVSNYNFLPGTILRDKNRNFRLRYYPYLGIEHYRLFDFLNTGETAVLSTYFIRLFAEIWVLPQTLQLTIDGTYRQVLKSNSSIKTHLPLLLTSLYFYPGKQDNFAIGYEYSHGYNNDNSFNLIQLSSLKLAWKI